MVLIPAVKRIVYSPGWFTLDKAATVYTEPGVAENLITLLQDRLQPTGHTLFRVTHTTDTPAVTLAIASSGVSSKGSEAYTITISSKGVTITGMSHAGLFYGCMTFAQIVSQSAGELPWLTIEDAPDFPHRGFYHDVTRGKVPTRETLTWLVDRLSTYKINQLQLYVEHAFAFSCVPEFNEGHDPLCADDITFLDKYCTDRHIDLVPSLATFGHLYELLRLPRFEHLNELELQASKLPHNLWDRMAHYTINPSDPESYTLITTMMEEYLPLFSSRYCNICCDETFDLGKGKNRATVERDGVGQLYVDFVVKIAAVAIRLGKIPMMWGDIVQHYPDLLGALPNSMVYLNWDYRADVSADAAALLQHAAVKQYVCPGVSGWSRFAHDIELGTKNIRRQIEYGRTYAASGVLNTDWGDCGHVNFLGASMHGMVFGAALSWNGRSFFSNAEFDESVSLIEWQDRSRQLGGLLRELGTLCFYHFGNIYAWITDTACLWHKEQEVQDCTFVLLNRNYHRAKDIQRILQELQKNDTAGRLDFTEFCWSARAVAWTIALLAAKKVYEYNQVGTAVVPIDELSVQGHELKEEFCTLWLARNRVSELRHVTDTLAAVITRCEAWSAGG